MLPGEERPCTALRQSQLRGQDGWDGGGMWERGPEGSQEPRPCSVANHSKDWSFTRSEMGALKNVKQRSRDVAHK